MGTLANTNAVDSIAVPSGAVNETPTHFSLWTASSGGTVMINNGALLDDDTGNTPTFDVALGETIQFEAGDFSFTFTPGTGQQEALFQNILDTSMDSFVQLHTGAPGSNGTSNTMTDMDRIQINAWTYTT